MSLCVFKLQCCTLYKVQTSECKRTTQKCPRKCVFHIYFTCDQRAAAVSALEGIIEKLNINIFETKEWETTQRVHLFALYFFHNIFLPHIYCFFWHFVSFFSSVCLLLYLPIFLGSRQKNDDGGWGRSAPISFLYISFFLLCLDIFYGASCNHYLRIYYLYGIHDVEANAVGIYFCLIHFYQAKNIWELGRRNLFSFTVRYSMVINVILRCSQRIAIQCVSSHFFWQEPSTNLRPISHFVIPIHFKWMRCAMKTTICYSIRNYYCHSYSLAPNIKHNYFPIKCNWILRMPSGIWHGRRESI